MHSLWIVLVLGTVLALGELMAAARRAENRVSLSSVGHKLLKTGEPLHTGDGAACTWVLLAVLLAVGYPIWVSWISQASQADAPVVTEQHEVLATKKALRSVAIYENEVFGATIHPMLVQKTIWAADPSTTAAHVAAGGVAPSPTLGMQDVRTIGPNGGRDVLWHATPEQTWNQFPGEYEITIKLKKGSELTAPNQVLGAIKIINAENKKTLQHHALTASTMPANDWTQVTLRHSQPHAAPAPVIELWSTGRVSLMAESITWTPVRVDMATDDIEDLYAQVLDESAHEGSARMADPIVHLPGVLAFGPYEQQLAPGEYTAIFRMKTTPEAARTEYPIARIQTANLVAGTNRQDTNALSISGLDLADGGEWHEIGLPITVSDRGTAEFRVYWLGRQKLWFDHVRIYPRGSLWDNQIKPTQQPFQAAQMGRIPVVSEPIEPAQITKKQLQDYDPGAYPSQADVPVTQQ